MLQLPVREGNAVVGSLELLRRRGEFDERERMLALAAADEIALARRAFGDGGGAAAAAPDLLGLAGDALAAGSDETRAADQVATLAAEATGASACVVWRYEQQGPVLAALSGTRSRPRSRSTPSAARATCPARSRSSRWRRAARS